jgi:hypothetical protein
MTELVIVCDGCGKRSAPHQNAGMRITYIRARLRLAGWESLGSGKDYCPACKTKRTAARPRLSKPDSTA